MERQVIKLYKIRCDKAFSIWEQEEGFSLYPSPKDTEYYEGTDDDGKNYVLPYGYHISKGSDEQLHICNSDGDYCSIAVHASGCPQLVSGSRCLKLLMTEEELLQFGKAIRKMTAEVRERIARGETISDPDDDSFCCASSPEEQWAQMSDEEKAEIMSLP